MKAKKQKDYFESQWQDMTGYLKSFLLEARQEDLHSFRVQIKRLRALFTILDDGGNDLQLFFKPVRKIFREAGIIRNAHINLKLGDAYQIKNEQFENSQRQIIETGVVNFKLNGLKFLKKIDKAHRSISRNLEFIPNKTIRHFYKENLDEINIALAHKTFDEGLHTSRKKIKTLVYNHKFTAPVVEKDLTFNNAYLDELQGAIGDWHDNILAIELFLSEEVNDKPVAAKIKRKNTKLEKKIIALSDDFLTKATALKVETEQINQQQ